MTPLTKDHIKAMRAADAAVCRFALDERGNCATASISLSKEVDRSDGFGRETLHVEVPTTAIVTNYGQSSLGSDDSDDWRLQPAIGGDWVLLCVRVRPEWGTFVHTLRAGDELVQRWVVDNRSVNLKRAGVSQHELSIEVRRPASNGRQRLYTYMLDATTSFPGTRYSEPVVRRQA